MYQEISIIIGSVFLPIIYIYIIKFPVKFEKYTKLKMVKPFNCGFCLSFWVALISLSLKTNFIDSIFISSAVPFIYLWVEDLLTNKFML
jgi:hypothetical protein